MDDGVRVQYLNILELKVILLYADHNYFPSKKFENNVNNLSNFFFLKICIVQNHLRN